MGAAIGTELLVSRADAILTITFNRPDRLNAWTREMELGLHDLLLDAAGDDGVRAIVLTGAGRGFCAGAEMGDLEAVAQGQAAIPQISGWGSGDFEQRYTYLLGIPKPIVAAINGPAAGVGLALALFCDLRFIAESAKVSAVFSRRGLIAEHGIAWMLPRLVPAMAAFDLLCSGRAVDAAETDAIGLAQRLPDGGFLEQVQARVAALIGCASPRSIAVIKRQLYRGWSQTLSAAVKEAEAEMAAALASEDFREGVAHFLERRDPVFTGR